MSLGHKKAEHADNFEHNDRRFTNAEKYFQEVMTDVTPFYNVLLPF